jgi:hypothetical protein
MVPRIGKVILEHSPRDANEGTQEIAVELFLVIKLLVIGSMKPLVFYLAVL